MSALSIYTQSIRSGRKFRLLTIRPALDPHQRLKCDCLTSDLDDAPSYEALSYVWGTPLDTIQILCNGQFVAIQAGLESALRVLRLRDTTRTVWADALCINQNDNEEKNHQVALMGSIYSFAKKVVVWLGHEGSEQAPSAFDCLEYISRACSQYTKDHGLEEDYYGRNYDALKLPVEAFSTSVCSSLKKLFNRPWFSRIWCIQEIYLAQDGLLLWGEHEISWVVLRRGLSWIHYQVITGQVLNKGDPVSDLLSKTDSDKAAPMRNKNKQPLLESLVQYNAMNSTDPRDKVYGLTNLVEPEEEIEVLDLDYNKSVGDVYADTALVGIRLYSKLSAFAYANHPVDYDGDDEDYRSWAPRWDVKETWNKLGHSGQYSLWGPGGSATITPNGTKLPAPRKLILRGIFYKQVRSVENVMDFFAADFFTYNNFDDPYPLLRFFTVVCPPETPDIQDDKNDDRIKQLERLARTVTADWCPYPVAKCVHTFDGDYHKRYYDAFIHLLRRIIYLTAHGEDEKGGYPHTADSSVLGQMTSATCHDRRIFWTESGFALGPRCMRKGDVVVVLHGGNTPYILRPRGDEYLFIGQAYVDEIMHGEIMRGLSTGEVKEEDFCLV